MAYLSTAIMMECQFHKKKVVSGSPGSPGGTYSGTGMLFVGAPILH